MGSKKKKQQNKTPDILKVIFTKRILRSFANPRPHWSLDFPHSLGEGEEKVQSRVFLLLSFRLL